MSALQKITLYTGCVLGIILLHGYPNGLLCALTTADFLIDKHLFKEMNGNYTLIVPQKTDRKLSRTVLCQSPVLLTWLVSGEMQALFFF